jgi:hypothetical protein
MKIDYLAKAKEILSSIKAAEYGSACLSRDGRSYDFIVQYPPPLTIAQAKERLIYD